ncbi:M48 family metallopeptidase [Engelhardtia mirabilis]|uniref:Protease HtpX n=1 Tax=Engelhardtia mirabilis TaxID=2528011 RepID=A0A518BG73_9BACT|nr:Protease HtpX [Planctomycetes bacterium Pla133]QDV00239.1 Protease HtpX [Planctomycetes bacterium Pla86]
MLDDQLRASATNSSTFAQGTQGADRAATAAECVSIEAAIAIDGPKPKAGLAYRVNLVAVALAMVLLPMVYAGLVLGLGLVTIWYPLNAGDLLPADLPVRGKALAYVLPTVAGLAATLFLLKPLLSRRPKGRGRRELKREQEPKLFAFLDGLADGQGAPRPVRVEVDLRVNASASLVSVRSLVRGDLVLTLGLPLVAGLDVRSFAAVVAHEYGHFAQGTAMRAYWVIATVHGWFERVVFERDQWDERIESVQQRTDWISRRMALPIAGARGMVWVSRRILLGLMRLGELATAALSRQMEFDADAHAVRVVGTEVFEAMLPELSVIDSARRNAEHDTEMAWREHSLPEDLVALTVANLRQFSPEARDELREHALASAPRWYASHPPGAQRIKRARSRGGDCRVNLDGPASRLFADFGALSRDLTISQHRAVLGGSFDPQCMVAAEDILAVGNRRSAERGARGWLFGEGFRLPEIASASLRAATDALGIDPSDRYEREEVVRRRLAGHALAESGIKFKPSLLDLDSGEPLLARGDRRTWDETRQGQVGREAAPILGDVRGSQEWLAGAGRDEEAQALGGLIDFVEALGSCWPAVHELGRCLDVLDRTLDALTDQLEVDRDAAQAQIDALAGMLRCALDDARDSLGSLVVPADASVGCLWPEDAEPADLSPAALLRLAGEVWSQLERGYEECLGALAVRVKEVAVTRRNSLDAAA